MRDPTHVYVGSDLAPDLRTRQPLQQWLKDNYSHDDGSISVAAQNLRAENARRFAAHLARCPRASRTS